MLDSFLTKQLDVLDAQGLRRKMRTVEGIQDGRIILDGVEVLNFCSNNYLGLAGDSRLAQAASEGLKKYGFGSGASRLICGNMSVHRELEQRIAQFKGAEDCLVFSSGYMANVGIIAGLFGRDDVIFSDRLNHASIIDGILLSGAKMKRYAHTDMGALEDLLKASPAAGKRVIITDSVFSMDGDVAPLKDIVQLAKQYDCSVMIDEAHALGVFGAKGSGLAEHLSVSADIDIQMGTLSKAAGSFGAYVCGPKKLIDLLLNKARSFIYTTGMPPSVAAASIKAIEIIEHEDQTRSRLWDNTRYVLAQLKLAGFNTGNSRSPIIPVVVEDSSVAVEFSKRLLEKGVFVSAIRPPTVPHNTARLRLTVMAKHKKKDLDYALDQLQNIGRELCLI